MRAQSKSLHCQEHFFSQYGAHQLHQQLVIDLWRFAESGEAGIALSEARFVLMDDDVWESRVSSKSSSWSISTTFCCPVSKKTL
ncbi:Adenosylhomocysteinase [Frankliniella fusca]|uniref:Adenosylhomocysteinase n=1 Tax=Frankliniella fusca TaxID=407009 RepID=A0AAE1HTA0_9NEOP|nr:Adenosylhomocysteinase [Frankliniella fusca]